MRKGLFNILCNLLYCERPLHSTMLNNKETRRYPWGIQRLVSTHQFPGEGEVVVVQPNSTQIAKIYPNLHFRRGDVQTNIPEILEWGLSRNFEPKILAT